LEEYYKKEVGRIVRLGLDLYLLAFGFWLLGKKALKETIPSKNKYKSTHGLKAQYKIARWQRLGKPTTSFLAS